MTVAFCSSLCDSRAATARVNDCSSSMANLQSAWSSQKRLYQLDKFYR